MVKENYCFQTVVVTKENLSIIKNMVLVNLLKMGIPMKVNGKTMYSMGKD